MTDLHASRPLEIDAYFHKLFAYVANLLPFDHDAAHVGMCRILYLQCHLGRSTGAPSCMEVVYPSEGGIGTDDILL